MEILCLAELLGEHGDMGADEHHLIFDKICEERSVYQQSVQSVYVCMAYVSQRKIVVAKLVCLSKSTMVYVDISKTNLKRAL